MKKQTVKGLGIKVPDTKAFTINTAENLPKLHGVIIACGKRGSGKGVAVMNLLRQYQETGCLDRLFIVTPTYYSNKHIFDLVKYDEEDVYHEPTKANLELIMAEVEKEAEDYEDYIEKLKLYKKYQRYIATGRGTLNDNDIFDLYDTENQTIEPPKHKYNGKKPVLFVFFDDCQGSEIFGVKSKLANYVISHRHRGAFKKSHGALGVSMVFAVQSYKSAGGGLPRALRGQATQMILFRTKDENELKDIAEECSGEVAEETFRQVYKEAVDEPHSFLFVDFHPKEHFPSMFRKRFDQFLVVDKNNEEK